MLSRPPPRIVRLSAWLVTLGLAVAPFGRAQSDGSGTTTESWDISDLLDRLPNMSPFRKLQDKSPFPVRYYARPRLGDFFHRDYLRLPVGMRAKPADEVELLTEVESYFTHGFGDGAGYGLSKVRVGGKYEKEMTILHPFGWSVGTEASTPVSRPPMELTDGHRHVQPYFAVSKMLVPTYNLIAYSSIAADFLSHTALAPNFGRNQLHGNSVTLSSGLTRDFKRFRVAVTGTWSTTSLLTDENRNVFALRPDILIPLTKTPSILSRTHLLLIVGGRAVHGPDGTELGVAGNLRIEFAVQSGRYSH
ncbi:MAG: hypothetical protein JWM88_2082 [Verrucomicrobia bacterium]|nr:hypothetical protein [Verrucomicrobiota bacterium]